MTDDLVKRLHRVSGWLFDTGQTGYELDTVKEAADRIEQLEAALRAVVTNWEVPTYGHDADKLDNVFDAVELARAALEGDRKNEQS
jgi:hypothetical protein